MSMGKQLIQIAGLKHQSERFRMKENQAKESKIGEAVWGTK
jgi:hypothetical protein